MRSIPKMAIPIGMTISIRISQPLYFRMLLVVLVSIAFLGIKPQSTAYSLVPDQSEKVPRFVEGDCQKIFPQEDWKNVDQTRFRCGYFITRLNYDTQNGTIWLRVRETYPKGPKPYPDPIIWLVGGPGSSGFEDTPSLTLTYVDKFGAGFIQFSQRGSYLSETELKCPEYHTAITSNWDKPAEKTLGWEEWSSVHSEALVKCFQKDLESKYGTDYLVNFNSKFNALDVVYLLREMGYGYGHANLYGGSYGTLLAQHVLALSPGDIHAVVLQGVAPLGVDWNAEYPRNMRNSLQLVFDACNTSSKCRETYPNLEHTFFVLLGQLKDKPLCISAKGDKSVCLDDYGFLLALGNMLYETENIKKIPRIIYEAWNRDTTHITELEGYYYADERDENFPWGMHYSIYCSEFARFDPDSIDLRQVEPQFQTIYTASKQLINKICPLYDQNGKSYGDIGIVSNKIPVLIFQGKFDPVTPEKYGKQVADALSIGDGFLFTSNRRSHDSVNDCAAKLMKDFFHEPKKAPENNCWRDESKPIEFELVLTGNQGTETPESQEPQVPIGDIFNGWIQSLNDWWQQLQESSADGLNKWWQEQQDKIKDAFNQWWQDQQEKATDALNKWWQDFQKQLADWFEQQFIAWLNQLCGSALLPAGAVASVWVYRRRKGKVP
jgi:pimeloyl-ACP methyl ester carboxylesterase